MPRKKYQVARWEKHRQWVHVWASSEEEAVDLVEQGAGEEKDLEYMETIERNEQVWYAEEIESSYPTRALTVREHQQYVKQGGSRCPYSDCEYDHVEGSSVNIEDGNAFQEINCLQCGRQWTAVYKLQAANETGV